MLKNTSEVTGEGASLIGWVDAVIHFVQSHRCINAVDTDKLITSPTTVTAFVKSLHIYLSSAALVAQLTGNGH